MPDAKRPRGRPPSPQGPRPPSEIQRAYRERRKAAGKVVVTVDTWTTSQIELRWNEIDRAAPRIKKNLRPLVMALDVSAVSPANP